MWYNEEQQTRGYTVTFPDGLTISAEDADKSPLRGWEWHEQPPQWWNELNSNNDGINP
jgi:hypothetical protein